MAIGQTLGGGTFSAPAWEPVSYSPCQRRPLPSGGGGRCSDACVLCSALGQNLLFANSSSDGSSYHYFSDKEKWEPREGK